jgi:hypothetical protein
MFTRDEVAVLLTKIIKDGSELRAALETLDDAVNSALVEDEPLPFGKHKGNTLTELYNQDKKVCLKYCRFLVTAKDKNNEELNWVEESFPELFNKAQEILAKDKSFKKRKLEVMTSPGLPDLEDLKRF